MSSHIENVAIVGATGNLGRAFLEELLKTGKHTVTVLTRDSSKGAFPVGAKVVEVDYNDESSVVAALNGQQFLAIVLSAAASPEMHSNLVKAAVRAGVRYIMPTAYGGDISNERLAEEDIYTKACVAKAREIQDLGAAYIVMTCGFWYEWGLVLGELFFGFNIKDKKVTFFDDGNAKINASTWQQCGRALAALLRLPESGSSPSVSDWKNQPFRFASFRVSQRDMLDSIHRVAGTSDKDWEITYEPARKRVADGLVSLQNGDRSGFAKAMYSYAFCDGNGDYETSAGISNEALGLPKEDLDASTKTAIEMVESGWSPF